VHCTYDLEIDGTRAVEDNVETVVSAWRERRAPSAFHRMLAAERHRGQNGS